LGKKVGLSLLLVIFLFAITTVSAASLDVHQIDTDLEIYQECNNCTYCNFTIFKDPSGITLLTGMEANVADTHYYYTILSGNITKQGDYFYCYKCGNTAEAAVGCIDVPVNYTGRDITPVETTFYLGVLLFLVGIMIYLIYLYPKLPQHAKNDDGYVINASQLSYLRPVMLGVMWVLVLSITYIVANISIAYISAGFLGSFIFGIWTIMMYSNFLLLPLWVVYIIHNIIRAGELKEFLERGGTNF